MFVFFCIFYTSRESRNVESLSGSQLSDGHVRGGEIASSVVEETKAGEISADGDVVNLEYRNLITNFYGETHSVEGHTLVEGADFYAVGEDLKTLNFSGIQGVWLPGTFRRGS